MKVNEILTEASVADTIKAIASKPGLIADPANIRQTANKLRTDRDVGQLTLAMIKVWNNLVSAERDKRQGLGADGTIDDQTYKTLLTAFIQKNLVGGSLTNLDANVRSELADIINQVTDARDRADAARVFPNLFGQLIGTSLVARSQVSPQTNTPSSTDTSRRPVANERTAMRELEQALDQLGIKGPMRKQIGGLVSQLGGGQSVRSTNNPAVDAFLMSMGIKLQ